MLHAEHQPLRGIDCPGTHQTFRNPRTTVATRELPELKDDFVRVQMEYVGVCGTDLHAVQADLETGYMCTSSPASIPPHGRVLGHEGIGRVLQTGDAVRDLSPGAWVVFDSIIACRECSRCRRGFPNQCERARLLGLEEDGLFTTTVDVPAAILHDVSAEVQSDADARDLALLEPAGVAFVACEKARVAPGDSVTIFGAGPIGIYCAMLARTAFGAEEIEVIEPVEFRRNFAARWADRVFTPDEFAQCTSETIDVVFEASGVLANVDNVLRRMNAGGRIIVLGRSGDSLKLSAPDQLITNAVSIAGSRGHHGSLEALLALHREKKFSPADAVTSVLTGLENLAEILRMPAEVSAHDCKILVRV